MLGYTLLLELVSDIILHVVELGKYNYHRFVFITEELLKILKLL